MKPGLCSITLRQLPIGEVADLCGRAGIAGIEWGADVHVPVDDKAAASEARTRSADQGIEVVSYGSYFGMQPGDATTDHDDTRRVLDTTEALGAPMVRIWTEFGVDPSAPAADRARVRDRVAAFATCAADRGLDVALEFHPWCLTHTAASAVALLAEIDAPNLHTHWQPDPTLSTTENLRALEIVLPWLAHLHTFAWGPAGISERYELSQGVVLWQSAIAIAEREGRYALLEYVRDDDPQQLLSDAQTLRTWLNL